MDALTLLAAIAEARPLVGAAVRGVSPAGPAAMWLECLTERGVDGVLFSADPAFPHLVRGAPRPSRRPLGPLEGAARRVLAGGRLDAILHEGLERVCRFVVVGPEGEWHLVAELFGTRPNLLLINGSGQIQEQVRHEGSRVGALGHTYSPPPGPKKPDPRLLGDAAAIQAILAAHPEDPLLALRGLSGLSDLWAREVVARAADASPAAVAQSLLALIGEAAGGPWTPRVLLGPDGDPAGVSPLRLSHLSEDRQRPAGSLCEAVQALCTHLSGRDSAAEQERALRHLLRRMKTRLHSRLHKLQEESTLFAQADLQQRMGALLVAHQRLVPRGATEAVLADPSGGEGATLAIPLDPALSPSGNAERLFKQARRGRRGTAQVAARLADTEAALDRVRAWTERLAAGPDALSQIEQELARTPRMLTPQDRAALVAQRPTERPVRAAQPAKEAGGPAPRRFVSSDGFPILVGRNNEGNDYLTLHLARSEDLWLHVQHRGGSHVVVRVQNRPGGIPKRTLLQAAQLAAYYSQARNEGKVEVSYTLKKYVRKPRKAPPGLVTITQEKSVLVSPDKSLIDKLAVREESED
jgi:predicted ribosome quality control (RQC) complex YloA/Tae2 family protein